MNKNIILVLTLIICLSLMLPNVYATSDEEVLSIQIEDNTDSTETILTDSEDHHYTYTNSETKYQVVIEDDANLLTIAQIQKLAEEMKPLSEYGNVMFKSTNYNYQTPRGYAHDCYYDKYRSQSGTLFLIDMQNRQLYIHSDGEMFNYITGHKADTITDNVYRYATKGDYYTCSSKVYQQINKVMRGDKISEPMKYTSNALISLICGFFISFLFVWSNSKIKSAGADEILKSCKINFKVGNITAEANGQRKVYSPVSDSSSSGFSSGGGGHGSGHSSHGSHSSGGGGGHGF